MADRVYIVTYRWPEPDNKVGLHPQKVMAPSAAVAALRAAQANIERIQAGARQVAVHKLGVD